MRADKDPSEWPEVRDGRLTCDLVVGEAHQDLGAPCADAEVARSTAALLIRLTRRGFGIAPASRRAPKSDDLPRPARSPTTRAPRRTISSYGPIPASSAFDPSGPPSNAR